MELLKSRPNGKEEVSGELGSSGSSLWNEGISISSFGSSTDSSLWNSPALLNTEQSGPAPAGGLPPNVIDLRNHFLATPLHRAAAKGHAEVSYTESRDKLELMHYDFEKLPVAECNEPREGQVPCQYQILLVPAFPASHVPIPCPW